MKFSSATVASATFAGLAAAFPLAHNKREVPQEHSHDFVLTITNEFLAKDNPKGITDAVFGLLGNKAAAEGAGSVTDPDCLKQETADQAFTNAKAASDLRGMAGALLYQAIERNTAKVGLASVLCSQTAVNPEIAALSSHQDPASDGAAATNKAITLELAKQLAAIGADPNLALLSGTFAPGDVNDPTGAGNSCDTVEADLGCIFSQNLLVLDATTDEIAAAVADVTPSFNGKGGITAADLVDLTKFSVAGGANAAAPAAPATPADGTAAASAPVCSVITTTVAASDPAATSAAVAAPIQTGTGTGTGTANLQSFTGALGGPPPPVQSSASDRPFSTNGATFNNLSAALSRSCDVQHNKCADAANSGQLAGGTAQCETQNSQCHASVGQQKRQAALDFGSCSDPGMIFADGLDGRKEASFEPSNKADFNHGSALGNKVITSFICGQLQSACKASADAVASCQKGADAAASATGQAAADAFNSALGVGGGAAAGNTGSAGDNSSAGDNGSAADAGSNAGSNTGAGLDLGSCSDPSIIFATGLDGRSGAAFAPANKADFDHGSANGIGVITSFICGQLANKCKAGADAIAACSTGSTAAAAASGQAAADAFNAAMGVDGTGTTGGAAVTPVVQAVPSASVVMTITQCA